MKLSEQLKEATKTNHQLLEKRMIGDIKAIRTKQDYAALLSCFYGYFGGLEKAIQHHINLAVLPDYAERRKAAALADDLQELGNALPATATDKALPTIYNHLQAMGALYVMEGSTLGGRIISKIIRQQLAQPEMEGLSFFSGYGEKTDAMWQTFKAAIDQPLSAEEMETVIQSADATFLLFRHWFERSCHSAGS